MNKREFVQSAGALAVLALAGCATGTENKNMYGIIGKMIAEEGKRQDLIDVLLAGTENMPGCKSYIISKDASDDNAIWITEFWDSKESHAASLTLDSVKDAIERGRPMIAGFGERFEVEPVGGQGLT